jgi:hypothetical protein
MLRTARLVAAAACAGALLAGCAALEVPAVVRTGAAGAPAGDPGSTGQPDAEPSEQAEPSASPVPPESAEPSPSSTPSNAAPSPEAPAPQASGSPAPGSPASSFPPYTPDPQEQRIVPPGGVEEGPRPAGLPLADLDPTKAKGWKPLQTTADNSRAVTWPPCRPIHWVLNPDGMPPWGRRLVDQAVAEIAQATKLRFVYDGETDEPTRNSRDRYQPETYGDRWVPVLIGWSTATSDRALTGDVLGYSQVWSEWRVTADSETYVTGWVRLDAPDVRRLRQDGGDAPVRALIVHELAHVVGLDHVKDRSQLMYPELSPDNARLGAGDRRGLTAMGQGPCSPRV